MFPPSKIRNHIPGNAIKDGKGAFTNWKVLKDFTRNRDISKLYHQVTIFQLTSTSVKDKWKYT
jgi:hypothetical protein